MEQFATYFLLFIGYSFLGWLLEVTCKLIQYKRFINRGFLIGPVCPIYGYGVMGILFLIGEGATDVLGVFLKSILICSILEYFTSYFMEKLFKARWWDYSQKKFNINGRICLETMLPFGILGTFIYYILNPLLLKLIVLIPTTIRIVIAVIILVIYIVDTVVSFNVMNKIKNQIKKQYKDSTEIIHKQITHWLEKNTFLFRHIKEAYPKFKIIHLRKK